MSRALRLPPNLPAVLALLYLLGGCAASLPSPALLEVEAPERLRERAEALEARVERSPQDAEALQRLALVELRLERLTEAERHALQAAEAAPFNARVLDTLGRVYEARGHRLRAAAAYQEAVEAEPDYLPAYVGYARMQAALGDTGSAERSLQQATRREPDYYPAHLALARVRLESGAPGEAEAAIEEARRVRPDAPEAQALQVRIYQAQGRLTAARLLAEEALAAESDDAPGHGELRHLLLEIHVQRADWAAARQALRPLQARGTLSAPDRLLRAEVLRGEGRADAARRALEALLGDAPAFVPARLTLGRWLLEDDRPEEALTVAQAATDIDPASVNAHVLVATAQYRLGRPVQGDAALTTAEQLNARNAEVRLLRIARLLAQRRLAPTVERLEAFREDHPAELRGWLMQARLDVLRGAHGAAEEALAHIPADSLQVEVALTSAASAYLRARYDTVLLHTAPLLERDPAPWRAVYLHAAAQWQRGRLGEATALLRAHLERPEGAARFHRLLGDLHFLAGDLNEAERVYQAGLARHPREPLLVEGLSRLALARENWSQARQVLRSGLEQPAEFEALFLERLRRAQEALGEDDAARETLRRYLEAVDPLLREVQVPSEPGLLVPGTVPLEAPAPAQAEDTGNEPARDDGGAGQP